MATSCLNCGGLISHQGEVMGYAGKFCSCPIDPAKLYQRRADQLSTTQYCIICEHNSKRIQKLEKALQEAKAALDRIASVTLVSARKDYGEIKDIDYEATQALTKIDEALK
jgi:hypothetical protein